MPRENGALLGALIAKLSPVLDSLSCLAEKDRSACVKKQQTVKEAEDVRSGLVNSGNDGHLVFLAQMLQSLHHAKGIR